MNGQPGMRLGCRPRPEGVTAPLLMAKYLKDLPPAPEKIYREYKIPADTWGMFKNDQLGNCTCAAIAHMLMVVTAHTGKLIIPDEQSVVDFYSAVSGYNPATGANDNGSDLPTVLNRWRDVGLCGHKIEHQKLGIYIFGATDDAVLLPDSAMAEFAAGMPWDDVKSKGEDGHSIPRFGYGSAGNACVSWARVQYGTWAWWEKNIFESCVVLTQDWINNADGLTPSEFNIDGLRTEMAALKA